MIEALADPDRSFAVPLTSDGTRHAASHDRERPLELLRQAFVAAAPRSTSSKSVPGEHIAPVRAASSIP